MRRDANPSLAQAHDNIFLSQPLIKLGSFLLGRRGEAPVRPALCAVQRTGPNAVLGKAFEQELDQFTVVFEDQIRPNAQHKINRGVHGRQVEIEMGDRFRRVPTVRAAGWRGINKIQRRKTVCALGHPIKRPWTRSIKVFALGPKKSCAPGAEEPFISGAHQKVSAKLVYIHWHRPARLARIQHKDRSLRVTGRSHARRI